jgi:hypothetical protein
VNPKLTLGCFGLLACGALWCPVGLADVCQVPSGAYPTIQAAVDDGNCTEVLLAAQVFEESVLVERDLTLQGVSQLTTTIAGQVTIQGEMTQAVVENLTVDATVAGVGGTVDAALQARAGAELTTRSVSVRNSAVDLWMVFADGFESGDTGAWSSTVP